jgi:hypothetical protein
MGLHAMRVAHPVGAAKPLPSPLSGGPG